MITSNVALAFREIRRNLFRSCLTILGIVIGVAAVIAIATIGNGATITITENISSLGANLLFVIPGTDQHGPPRFDRMGATGRPFSMDDLRSIGESVEGVEAIAPSSTRPMFAKTESINLPTLVTGTTQEYFVVRDLELAQGQGLDTKLSDDRSAAVVGPQAARNLFGDADAIGNTFLLGDRQFQVTGLLETMGENAFGFSQDDSILVPIDAIASGQAENGGVGVILIKVTAPDRIEAVTASIKTLLRTRRELEEGHPSDFRIRGVDQIVEQVRRTTGILTSVVGAIAGISLFVGGIGIMNVMLVTVTERTREIGVRMAIGAQGRDVLLQFLVESSVLASFGGLVGIAVGLGGGAIATHFIGLPFRPDPLIVMAVFAFSGLLGIVFGFLPARRAARLNPIDALRYE